MAFSYGFYNSINHDRLYDAVQLSSIFDGLILDGVFATVGDGMIVKSTDLNNTVIVSPGRAWFNHTWNLNDAEMLLEGDESEIILDRIDAVVLDINSNEAFRENSIIWVKGIPSSEPEKPTLIHEVDHNQYPLAYVRRKENTPIIKQEDITNAIGTSECPFVTGILQTLPVEELLLQWRDQWDQFVKKYEQTATTWTEKQKSEFEQFRKTFEKDLEDLKDSLGTDFENWFKNIKDVLDDVSSGKLQNEIDEIIKTEFDRYYDLVNSTTEINDTTGNITTTRDDATILTVFETSGSNDVIKTTITPKEGLFYYVRTTTISETSNGTSIVSKYSKFSK